MSSISPLLSTPRAKSSASEDGRRKLISTHAFQWCLQWYDSDGNWIAPNPAPDTRKTLCLCFGLLAGSDEAVVLANAILDKLTFTLHIAPRSKEEASAQFDIFITNHTVQMLVLHGGQLLPPIRQKLEKWGRAALGDFPGDRQCDYQFHGFNDNMPAKATLGMILGGEYFGDSEAVEHGLWNLRQLRDQLTRRGLLSEYTSPTYLPMTLVNLAEVALHARHSEARLLAGQCVERIWSDLLGHLHLPTGTMGGPYSRAYQLDATGHFSTAACLLWIALGDTIPFDPLDELNRNPIRLVHHHDSLPTQLGVLCWLASCPLKPPAYLLHWIRERVFPHRLQASAERGGEMGGEVNTVFYAEEEFAMGTAEGEGWTVGQSEAFFLQYRRTAPLGSIENLRTAYARMLIDGQRPGDREEDHRLQSHGLIHAYQQDGVAMVLCRPVLSLQERELQSLKLSVILPTHFGPIRDIFVQKNHVFLQEGAFFLALRPLNATDWGCNHSVRLETVSNYQLISFYNYEGQSRVFTRAELGRTLNGFVAITSTADKETFEAFTARVLTAGLTDYFHFGNRIVDYWLGSTRINACYHVEADRVRFATVNGQPYPRPVWSADGLPAARLPFLGSNPKPNTGRLPYRHLRVVWAPELPWQISASGEG